MELKVNSLFLKAQQLSEQLPNLAFGGERLRGAKRYKDLTLQETAAFLRDYLSLAESNLFSEHELSRMLGNTCVETGSFLFSAGISNDIWRAWCSVGGMLFYLAREFSYSMELLAISRMITDPEVAEAFVEIDFPSYREQAIRFIIFRALDSRRPLLPPKNELDYYYQKLIESLESGDNTSVVDEITRIAKFWLVETSYKFEPGIFPVFEPEINSVVAALVMQGRVLVFQNSVVKKFLRAGLEK